MNRVSVNSPYLFGSILLFLVPKPKFLPARSLLLAVLAIATPGLVCAQMTTSNFPRQHHPWGQFQPGTWKQVRVTAETLTPDGAVAATTVTETKSTLEGVDDQGFRLRVENQVQVEGKSFASPPQVVWQGFFGQQEGQKVAVQKVGASQAVVGGQRVPCENWQVNIVAGARERKVQICYAPTVSPHVIRREYEGETDGARTHTVAEIVSLGEPQEILECPQSIAKVKTTTTQGKASKVTLETVCEAVPGGVVQHVAQETDEQGRVVKRATLELIAYEIVEPAEGKNPPRRRLFHRRERRE